MDKVNAADSLVVRLSDGTLGIREATSIMDPDSDPTNELQLLSVNGDTLFLSMGNYIVIPGLGNVSLIPTCDDNTMNGNETDIDCGGPLCAPCPMLDIIMVIDNSGDMAGEETNVENSINRLSDSLEASTLDWRLILVSDFTSICFPPPLNPSCGGSPENTNRLYHYSRSITSHDALCKLIDGFTIADDYNVAPNGWQDWVRAGASKVFIAISNDGVDCTTAGFTSIDDLNTVAGGNQAADDFMTELENLSVLHFGTANDPNYKFISVIGISGPLPPEDPITLTNCSGGADPGTGYQALSKNTDATRYSICPSNFDSLMDNISNELITTYSGN